MGGNKRFIKGRKIIKDRLFADGLNIHQVNKNGLMFKNSDAIVHFLIDYFVNAKDLETPKEITRKKLIKYNIIGKNDNTFINLLKFMSDNNYLVVSTTKDFKFYIKPGNKLFGILFDLHHKKRINVLAY